MQNQFWVILGISLFFAVILFFIDYNNERKSKNTLLWGYGAIAGLLVIAALFYSSIPQWITGSIAMIALVFFGRYLTRQIANRKL